MNHSLSRGAAWARDSDAEFVFKSPLSETSLILRSLGPETLRLDWNPIRVLGPCGRLQVMMGSKAMSFACFVVSWVVDCLKLTAIPRVLRLLRSYCDSSVLVNVCGALWALGPCVKLNVST